MKYIRVLPRKDGTNAYRWTPPKAAADSGVTPGFQFDDYLHMRRMYRVLLAEVDQWKASDVSKLRPSMKLRYLADHYLNSEDYRGVSRSTQKGYANTLKHIVNDLGDFRLDKMKAPHIREVYHQWSKDFSIAVANERLRILSVLLNYGTRVGVVDFPETRRIRKLRHVPRSVIWKQSQVKLFVSTCFTQYRWRNLGVLCLLAHEWAQRPTDIRTLRWEQIDWQTLSVDIVQSKKSAEVFLPITPDIYDVLRQQEKDFGFQQWVVPNVNASDGCWKPMSRDQISRLCSEVLAEAALPGHLWIGDLRKTRITQMISAGLDIGAVRAVTGHASLESLRPYLRNDLSITKPALEKLRKFQEENNL